MSEPGDEESAVYARIFDRLMAEAVTGDEARRLIAAAAAILRERQNSLDGRTLDADGERTAATSRD